MSRPADPHRREAILQAARSVFLTEDYASARIAEIAARAGVAPGTVYLYFSSKDELVLALVENFFDQLSAAIIPVLAQADMRAAIPAVVSTAFAFADEERDLLRLARLHVGLGKRGHLGVPARERLHAGLAEVLAARMAAGELVTYDADVLAQLLAALVQWVAEVCLIEGTERLDRFERTLVQLLQHALLPETPTS